MPLSHSNVNHRTSHRSKAISNTVTTRSLQHGCARAMLVFLFTASVVSCLESGRVHYLDGSHESYLQYPPWRYFFDTHTQPSTVQSASFSLEFQLQPEVQSSRPAAGLLLYGHSPISNVFIHVSLISATAIRIRIDRPDSADPTLNVVELKQGLNFTDHEWHRLEITRHFSEHFPEEDNVANLFSENTGDYHHEAITLKVDSEIIHKRIALQKDSHHHHHQHHDSSVQPPNVIFVGGLPSQLSAPTEAARVGSGVEQPQSFTGPEGDSQNNNNNNFVGLTPPASVTHELHLRAAIRNVQYTASPLNELDNEDSEESDTEFRHQDPLEESSTSSRSSSSELESHCSLDQCKNGGFCSTTSRGVECDCSSTNAFSGAYCQLEEPTLETTIHGEYLSTNSSVWSFLSTTEQFELHFRSRHANGMLLFSSDSKVKSFLMLSLKNAAIVLQIRLGDHKGETTLTIEPNNVRFDDNQWHRVVVARKIRQISPSTFLSHFSITVDSTYTQHGSASDSRSHFVSSIFRIGAIESQLTSAMNNAAASNLASLSVDGESKVSDFASTPASQHHQPHTFSGCLRKIIYIADNIRLDVLDELARKRSNLLEYHSKHPGNAQSQLATSCDSSRDAHSDPITFTTSESFLKVPHGWNGRKQGVLSLKFRTNQANGVLLYASGVTAKSETSQASNVTSADYFAMELLDGHLYMLLFLGSTPIKIPASNRRVDDSKWHSIQVNRIDRKGEIILDDSVPVSFLSAGSSQHLDLANEIYLGGVSRFSTTPPELWSAGLGNGFVGCVRDLLIDQLPVDIGSLARAQDSGSIKPGCHAVGTATCAQNANVCLNGGFCTQSWNRVQCNCGSTAFTGSVCSKDATIYSFNGEQYFQVAMAKEMKSQAESLSFRFRTDKSDGLLFTTTHHRAPHQLSAYLKRGSVSVNINFGDRLHENIVQIGHNLNDDQWHTIQIERRGQNVHVELDNTDRKQTQLTSGHFTLLYDTLHLGSRMFIGKVHSHQHHIASFVGYMQNFIMNGHLYFELARDGQLTTGSTRITAKLGRKDRVLSDVATFKSKFTYVALPQLRAYSSLSVHFQFKTRDANALLFFNGGSGRDFVALELVNGRLHFIFDLGDGARRIQSKSSNPPLNDNRWHSVTLGRPWLYEHTMLVDDEQHSSQLSPVSGSSNTPVNLHLDLDGLLFVGGVREEMWSTLPRSIKARSGFEGCIASLELNGESVSLTGSQVLVASTLVEQGCSAPVTRCSSTACANRGVCVQLWNSYTCDCDLTSFSGPTCQDGTESTAFQFGPSNPGLITFAFDENNRPDTRNDLLALGFLTSVPNAVLVRVDSATTADYLQLEIADGNMLVVYNLGTEDIDIGDLDVKVNDGQYHIVRFTRTGQNSTLQIDNHNIISRTPAGAKQMNIFNAHAKIQLGGRKNVIRNTIEKSFTGIMAGLVFNGHRLLDIAAEDDARIKIEGEIEAMVSIRNNSTESNNAYATPSSELAPETNEQMQSEPKSTQHHPPATQHNSQNSNDDLIYSGAGSGCYDTNAGNDDDEENAEQCAHLHQDGSGDDLITPVYVAVNRLRPTRPSTNWNNNNNNGRNNGNNRLCNDDDEDEDDCVDGSGSSPYDSDSGYSDNDRNYDNNNNNNRNNYSDNYHQPSYGSSYTTWQPPTVPPMSRPPYSNNYQPPLSPFNTIPPFYYGGASNAEEQERILSSLRPKTTAPSWTKPIYSVAGPAKPPPMVVRENSQDPPEIYEVPLNIPEPSNDTDQSQNQNLPPPPEVLHRASNDRTVMIIGMIAICLIVVVIIAPIVLFFKVRLQAPDPAYKIETMFGAPKFGTLPIQPGAAYPGVMPVSRAQSISGMNAAAAAMQMQQAMVMAGQMGPQMGTNGRMQSRPPTRPGTPTHVDSMAMKKKDPHEWYV